MRSAGLEPAVGFRRTIMSCFLSPLRHDRSQLPDHLIGVLIFFKGELRMKNKRSEDGKLHPSVV